MAHRCRSGRGAKKIEEARAAVAARALADFDNDVALPLDLEVACAKVRKLEGQS